MVTLSTFMITNEMGSDIFPYHLQTQILSSPYFKGSIYLLLSYCIILGGKGYCIVAAIITFMFACVILIFAAKLDIKYGPRSMDVDDYLPEFSKGEDDEDIVTISEYEPPSISPHHSQHSQLSQESQQSEQT